MMFAPVGFGGGSVKIAPPLCITEEAIKEGCSVIREAIKELIPEAIKEPVKKI